jgi:acyl-CoA dehydrogenase
VSCGSIEHKMGIHGNATCVMNYDGAKGWLVGEENRGLAAMFVMMNEARLGVGVQGLAIAEVAYQNAVAYAQGPAPGPRADGAEEPDKPRRSDHRPPRRAPHADDDQGHNEAAARWCSGPRCAPTSTTAPTTRRRGRRPTTIMGLLTPVIKGVFTDKGFDNAVNMQQMFGGHGYIEEWGMSQFVRDARIAMIYEGANGVQALDLVGRKLGAGWRPRGEAFFRQRRDQGQERP